MVATTRCRPIAASLVSAIDAAGKLPRPVFGFIRHPDSRDPTQEEAEALSWLTVWDREPTSGPEGIAAYRDVYDYHTGRDVREVIYLAGGRRACFDVLHAMADGPRRLVGTFDMDNQRLFRFVERLGGIPTRIYFEEKR